MSSGLEIHHIVDFSKVGDHTFNNLILLCAVCHARATKREIDEASIRAYKANLSVLNQRYGEYERRVLTLFAEEPNLQVVDLPGGSYINLMYLVLDGFLWPRGAAPQSLELNGWNTIERWELTSAGRTFVTKWFKAERLDNLDAIGEE